MPEKIDDFVDGLYGTDHADADTDTDTGVREPGKSRDVAVTGKWMQPITVAHYRTHLVIELVVIVALFPLLVVTQMTFGNRFALGLSLAVIACMVLLFLFLLDRRKPTARELVTIATLVAIAVATRSLFFMLPQFKPVAAVVIISGVALGQETGFLVGALSILVSNIFFGQGPWTAWQMLAFGLIGFAAGALHHAHILPATRIPLTIFGFFSIFLIYGLIMNPSSVLMYTADVTPQLLIGSLIAGAPMDLPHALSTALFLLLLSRPLLVKLERLKVKYGLVEGM